MIPQRASGVAAGYADLQRSIAGLLAGEPDFIANCANFAALVFHGLPDLNWAGFYFLRGEELVLGPFQGQPACVRIAMGRGVCGTAAQRRKSVLVPDVHKFPGHIACDTASIAPSNRSCRSASRSELVVPMIDGDRLLGVFDLDSPRPDRFDAADQAGVEAAVQLLMLASRGNV